MALRHTISPQFSNRHSPPVTRSVSRTGVHQPLDTSTPVTRRDSQPGTITGTIQRFHESADDSEIDLNSSKFIYKEHFSYKEITSMKKEMWYDWLEYRIRMVRRRFVPTWAQFKRTLMAVVLFAMLYKYARDCLFDGTHHNSEGSYADKDANWASEKQKFHQTISNLRAEFSAHDKQLDFKTDHLEKLLENVLEHSKGWKESAIEELKQIKLWQAEISDALQQMKKEIDDAKSTKIIHSTPEKAPETAPTASLPPSSQLQPMHITRRALLGVNVANSLIGASIDHSCSSRPVSAKDGFFYDFMSYFGTFQEGYALLDRDVLSPGEAWCTYDKRATLTVKLARFVIPKSVSYQHVRWSGIVPNHAPKLYDVVACTDSCCTKWQPLVANCEYKERDGSYDEQEQFCSVPTIQNHSPINHVQFRFRENHGDMPKTCAYLIRVYGEPVDPPKETQPMTDNGTESKLESAIVNSVSETA